MITLLAFIFSTQAALFQKDERLLSTEFTNADWKTWSKSVGVIFGTKKFYHDFRAFGYLEEKAGDYKLVSPTLGESIRACPDMRFKDLPRAGHCTVSVVGAREVLTAGHCLMSLYNLAHGTNIKMRLKEEATDWPYQNELKIVINAFREEKKAVGGYVFKKDQVFDVVKIKRLEDSMLKDDFAVLEVDRDINAPALSYSSDMKNGDEVVMLGHPLGQPLMGAPGKILSQFIFQFTSDVDSFEGASGAPLMNLRTKKLIGLVSVGTGPSFEENRRRQCMEYKVYQSLNDYSTSFTKVARVFSEPSIVELFMSTLSHENDEDVFYSIYRVTDFDEYHDVLKASSLSFYYEALMNTVNFGSTTALEYLEKNSFPLDNMACGLYQVQMQGMSQAIRYKVQRVFSACP